MRRATKSSNAPVAGNAGCGGGTGLGPGASWAGRPCISMVPMCTWTAFRGVDASSGCVPRILGAVWGRVGASLGVGTVRSTSVAGPRRTVGVGLGGACAAVAGAGLCGAGDASPGSRRRGRAGGSTPAESPRGWSASDAAGWRAVAGSGCGGAGRAGGPGRRSGTGAGGDAGGVLEAGGAARDGRLCGSVGGDGTGAAAVTWDGMSSGRWVRESSARRGVGLGRVSGRSVDPAASSTDLGAAVGPWMLADDVSLLNGVPRCTTGSGGV